MHNTRSIDPIFHSSLPRACKPSRGWFENVTVQPLLQASPSGQRAAPLAHHSKHAWCPFDVACNSEPGACLFRRPTRAGEGGQRLRSLYFFVRAPRAPRAPRALPLQTHPCPSRITIINKPRRPVRTEGAGRHLERSHGRRRGKPSRVLLQTGGQKYWRCAARAPRPNLAPRLRAWREVIQRNGTCAWGVPPRRPQRRPWRPRRARRGPTRAAAQRTPRGAERRRRRAPPGCWAGGHHAPGRTWRVGGGAAHGSRRCE